MVLKEIINKSWYVANGFVESINSIKLLESYILYNLPILQKFKGIVISTTYKEQDPILIESNKKLWTKYFPTVILIDIKDNRGHSFGIVDSENALISYCKKNNIDWICKSSNDVLIQESILDQKIEEADFYYTNGISYENLYLNNFNYEKIYNEHFFPQTNFYFIRVDKIDYIYDNDYINEIYQYILSIPNYTNKIWEYFPEWSCELSLKRCVERNKLKKYYLLNKDKHNILCETINVYKIGDPSHKNIMINGVCHFQYPDYQILEV
jgi:hypothetical protein